MSRIESRAIHFTAARRWQAPALEVVLGEACPGLVWTHTRHSVQVEYLDTFDWLLLRAACVVERRSQGVTRELVLRALDQEPRRAPQPVAAGIVKPADISGRFLRDELLRLSEGRALFPVASTQRREMLFSLCDGDGKQRLQIGLRDERAAAGDGRTRQRLALMPLAGYADEARCVRAALASAGWSAAPDPLTEALAESGREPFDYPPATAVPLRANMPTREMVAVTGLRLLDVMQCNLPGLRDDIDVEFLHDFRVALRRTRTLLAEVREVLPVTRVRRFTADFRWMGGVSGAARDGDVQLDEFRQLAAARPPAEREALDPLLAWMHKHREETHRELLKVLASARFRRLCENWRSLLEQPPARNSSLRNAARPAGETAVERIKAVYKQLLRKGSRIDDDSPPEQVHELRKVAKKLRYLIEFFRPLYDEDRVTVLVGDLKLLQENLGEYQDLDVQRRLLEDFVPLAPPQTVAVLNRMAAAMGQREARVRAEFDGRFKAFSDVRVRRHLQAMLGLGRTAGSR